MASKNRLIYVAAAVIVLVLAYLILSGTICLPVLGCQKTPASAEEIAMTSVEKSLDTGRFHAYVGKTRVIAYMKSDPEKKPFVEQTGDHLLDFANKRRHVTTYMGGSLVSDEYVIGRMMYSSMDGGSTWLVSELEDDVFDSSSFVGSQKALMALMEKEDLGTEKIGGADTYIIKVTPRGKEGVDAVRDALSNILPQELASYMSQEISSIESTEWIEKDTYFLRKVHTVVTIKTKEEGDVVIERGLEFNNVNQQVTIELPPGVPKA